MSGRLSFLSRLLLANFVLFLFLPFVSRAQQETVDAEECSLQIDKMLRKAKTFLGTPYVWAADGPDSFDCSGYVHYIYALAGIEVKRNSKQLSETGELVTLREIKKGDLVFFVSGTPPERDITHVGIAITDYDGESFRFIHANSSAGCVSISDFKESRFRNSYGGARRLFPCISE